MYSQGEKFPASYVEHFLYLVQVSVCCCSHKKECPSRGRRKRSCTFGQSDIEPDLLPWMLKGSRVRLDQETALNTLVLRSGFSSTHKPVTRWRTGGEIGGDRCLSLTRLVLQKARFCVKLKLTQLFVCRNSSFTPQTNNLPGSHASELASCSHVGSELNLGVSDLHCSHK